MKALKAIYLDMDGVLVDFVGETMRTFAAPRDLRENVHGWDAIPEVLTKHLGRKVSDEEMWERIAARGSDFWSYLEWLPWGRALYDMCAAKAPVVLMTTPSHDPASAAGKMEWIQREIPKEGQRRYAFCPCKHHMAHPGALLIDDGQHNIDNFREQGGDAVLIPAPWNDTNHWPSVEQVLGKVRITLDSYFTIPTGDQ